LIAGYCISHYFPNRVISMDARLRDLLLKGTTMLQEITPRNTYFLRIRILLARSK